MDIFKQVFEYEFLGDPLQNWFIACGIFVAFMAVFVVLRAFLRRRFAAKAAEPSTAALIAGMIAEIASRTKLLFAAVVGVFLAARVLHLEPATLLWIKTAAVITLLIQAAIWGDALFVFWMGHYQRKHLADDPSRLTTLRAAGFVFRLAFFTVVFLLALDNIPGVEVTTLIASLGIGGIAVALALQNVLADLFASLSITFDKPFVIGDFIIVGDLMGTVEHIGLKTTRIRSLSGEQLVFSNNDLLSSRIRNYKRMAERRVVFTFGVTYQTPRDKLEKIPPILREIILAQPQSRFDRAHFKEFGDFSLNFEVVYYVLAADYNLYMDVQQAINFELHRRLEELEVEFAYPTQTLYLQRAAGPEQASPR